LDEGAAEIERAVDLDATDATAYGHLAGVYSAMGRLPRLKQRGARRITGGREPARSREKMLALSAR